VHELVSRSLAAAAKCGVKTILVSGGVAANRELRQSFDVEARRLGISVFFPSRELSTDNAAMIAAAAFARYSIGERAGSDLDAMPNMPLGGAV
jgi:N6-L-threonylcarbamoyladenine synthase